MPQAQACIDEIKRESSNFNRIYVAGIHKVRPVLVKRISYSLELLSPGSWRWWHPISVLSFWLDQDLWTCQRWNSGKAQRLWLHWIRNTPVSTGKAIFKTTFYLKCHICRRRSAAWTCSILEANFSEWEGPSLHLVTETWAQEEYPKLCPGLFHDDTFCL